MSEVAAVPQERAGEAVGERQVAALVWRYVVASSSIFLVAGALGGVLRQSQAHIVELRPGVWYQVMTAHGLAAFVGWAAFALMGVSFWVLAECDHPLGRRGFLLADVCWWSMVLGVCGVVVSTLALNFGGSWVFLYPLPFHSVGQWDEFATGAFAFSVLLCGISILAWCGAVLACVLRPTTHERGGTLIERLGYGLGFGLVSPRFQTRRARVPFPVIPLTVIAIDMIVATIPFALLLIEMIVQSIDSTVSVDPLLAKNVLWWFGHPVVYLLLFPSVAIYYHLVPRYAGRPLVAGRAIVIAWLIAVTTNMVIGAHHVYLDYPSGSFQASINTITEPLTLAIVTPSALSLYSLAMTIYRSEMQWTVPMQFLFAGLVSWLVAGMQGVINAVISFDVVLHNTEWIVGHFHNMALLNMGLVIFASIYAFLPRLTGREWYSDTLSKWHLWLTVIGGYGSVVPWMIQGIEGAPRRWADLPGTRYDALTSWSLPFVALIAIGQLLFAYNLIRSLGLTWLRPRTAIPPDDVPVGLERERGRDALGGLIAGSGIGLSLVGLLVAPIELAVAGIVAGVVGMRLGSARTAVVTLSLGAACLLVGVFERILP